MLENTALLIGSIGFGCLFGMGMMSASFIFLITALRARDKPRRPEEIKKWYTNCFLIIGLLPVAGIGWYTAQLGFTDPGGAVTSGGSKRAMTMYGWAWIVLGFGLISIYLCFFTKLAIDLAWIWNRSRKGHKLYSYKKKRY